MRNIMHVESGGRAWERGYSNSYDSLTNEKHIETASNHQNSGRGSKSARCRVHMAHVIEMDPGS